MRFINEVYDARYEDLSASCMNSCGSVRVVRVLCVALVFIHALVSTAVRQVHSALSHESLRPQAFGGPAGMGSHRRTQRSPARKLLPIIELSFTTTSLTFNSPSSESTWSYSLASCRANTLSARSPSFCLHAPVCSAWSALPRIARCLSKLLQRPNGSESRQLRPQIFWCGFQGHKPRLSQKPCLDPRQRIRTLRHVQRSQTYVVVKTDLVAVPSSCTR